MMKMILSLLSALFFLVACSGHSSEADSINSYHYNTTLSYDETVLELDSISECIIDSAKIDAFFANDSAFIEIKDGKETLTF